MKRRVGVVVAALCLLPGLALSPAFGTAPASSAPPAHTSYDVQSDPLEVTLQSLTPSVIPRRGPIEMTGLVVNRSDETWTDLKVYPWRSTTPITTVLDLDLAAQTDPALGVGTRIIDTYSAISELAPGATAFYHLTVPRSQLGIGDTTGIYWIGVQVLASSADGRDSLTDGRARTFMPLVRGRPDGVQVALVVPIRHDVVYARNGRLRDVRDWLGSLQPGGQLRNVVQFVQAAPASGATLLVDPAVVDAVRRLAAGNPDRDLGPADVEGPTETPSPSSAAGSPLARTAAVDATTTDAAARWAADWLDLFDRAAAGRTVLALPYADLDVDAASQLDPALVDRALAMTEAGLKDLGTGAQLVVAPPSGYLDPSSIAALTPQVRLLTADEALPGRGTDPSTAPTELTVSGHAVRLFDTAASSGGPGPGNPYSAVQVRQRLLAETALRALAGTTEPLVVSMPSTWNPGVSVADFFSGLAQDWVVPVTEPIAGGGPAVETAPDALAYPDRLRDRELPRSNFDAADQLIRSGVTLQNVLSHPTDVGRETAVQALSTLAYGSRGDPVQAELDALGADKSVVRTFEGIHISAPPYVTLSSTNGRFRVDLSNDLDQAVTVRIEALTDPALTIEAPPEVDLKGHSSRTVLLNARSTKLGVHQVTLIVTDTDGTSLGPTDSLPIRANEVGRVIWFIISGGAALLFGAIVLRLYRRFTRRRRRTPAPTSTPSPGEGA